jgi:hypothetical protein
MGHAGGDQAQTGASGLGLVRVKHTLWHRGHLRHCGSHAQMAKPHARVYSYGWPSGPTVDNLLFFLSNYRWPNLFPLATCPAQMATDGHRYQIWPSVLGDRNQSLIDRWPRWPNLSTRAHARCWPSMSSPLATWGRTIPKAILVRGSPPVVCDGLCSGPCPWRGGAFSR